MKFFTSILICFSLALIGCEGVELPTDPPTVEDIQPALEPTPDPATKPTPELGPTPEPIPEPVPISETTPVEYTVIENQYIGMKLEDVSDKVIENIHFKNMAYAGIYLKGNCSNIVMRNLKFTNCGETGVRSRDGGTYTNIKVIDNIFDNTYFKRADGRRFPEDMISFYGGGSNILVARNTVTNMGHAGTNFHSYRDKWTDCIIEDNTYINIDVPYSRAFGWNERCERMIFRNNKIYNQNVRSQVCGVNNEVYGNEFTEGSKATSSRTYISQGLLIGTFGQGKNNRIYDNIFDGAWEGAIQIMYPESTGNIIEDNIFKQRTEDRLHVMVSYHLNAKPESNIVRNNIVYTNISEDVVRLYNPIREVTLEDAETMFPNNIYGNKKK